MVVFKRLLTLIANRRNFSSLEKNMSLEGAKRIAAYKVSERSKNFHKMTLRNETKAELDFLD